ncbi:MAG TPA: cache domain-containing protein [Vicinamibacteria bacterium]|nr:cache domain-containing protein [Vicinamibacteria bacterium]
MGKRHYYLDTRVLAVFFFVSMPFVAFGSFVVVRVARGLLQDTVGGNLEQRALQTKLLLERYVGDQVVHLRLLALDESVRQALQAPARPASPEDLKRIEQAWAAGTDAKSLEPLLGSSLALRLRELTQVRPAVKLIQVVDNQGRLLASSSRAGRVLHTDMPWFRSLSTEGTEMGPYIGDIRRPAGGRVAVLDLGYPVDLADGRRLGAVYAVIDALDLYTVLAPVRVGRTGHALLLRAKDGLILASDESHKILLDPFPGFAAIEAAMRERRGFWIVPQTRKKPGEGGTETVEPTRLVGYSLVEQMPGPQWLVVVEQDLAEAMAPVEGITRYLWMHFIGAFGTVILLALYFSFKLETPVIEEELHLHEEHVPSGIKATES